MWYRTAVCLWKPTASWLLTSKKTSLSSTIQSSIPSCSSYWVYYFEAKNPVHYTKFMWWTWCTSCFTKTTRSYSSRVTSPTNGTPITSKARHFWSRASSPTGASTKDDGDLYTALKITRRSHTFWKTVPRRSRYLGTLYVLSFQLDGPKCLLFWYRTRPPLSPLSGGAFEKYCKATESLLYMRPCRGRSNRKAQIRHFWTPPAPLS